MKVQGSGLSRAEESASRSHARPFEGVFKSQFIKDLSTVGDKYPKNGSKNQPMAPTTNLGCRHEGPRVVRKECAHDT